MRLRFLEGHQAAASPLATARAYDTAWAISERWHARAHQRREAATDSAADLARWDRILAATARRPERTTGLDFVGLCLLVSHVRELLTALRDTLPPQPSVADIARQISDMVHNGTLTPGRQLGYKGLARRLGHREEQVRLALHDLVTAGTVLAITDRYRVPPRPLPERTP